MAEGQRLRWWQEQEEPGQVPQRGLGQVTFAALLPTEAPAALVAESVAHDHDTWAELEAEALRRSRQVITEEAESVSFYTDKSAALLRYNQYRRLTARVIGISFSLHLALTAALYWWLISQIPELLLRDIGLPLSSPLLGLLLGQTPSLLIVAYVKRHNEWLQNSTEPAVRLSPQGIHLGAPDHRNVVLPWDDVASVKPERSGRYPHLELRDIKKRRFAVRELYLPFTVEVLAAHIEKYKAGQQPKPI